MVLALGSALLLAACGGDDEPSDEAREAAPPSADTGAERTPTETTAQPPPETAPGGGATTAAERGESTVEGDAVTGPQSCPDVVVTPNSGNGLFAVEAEGITCEDAGAALRAWGASGYPGGGPPGFACDEVSEGRLSCEQEASGGVVAFDTGG